MNDLIFKLAHAIARQEGFFIEHSVAQRNNNPGNIWDGVGKGKVQRIFPRIPLDDKGFLKFENRQHGTAYLYRMLILKISSGVTLEQLIHSWAPPTENDTEAYVSAVEKMTGINRKQVLWDLLAI